MLHLKDRKSEANLHKTELPSEKSMCESEGRTKLDGS